MVQAAMGWLDGHLHRFRTGADHRSPSFITPFDVEEGEEGVLESDVRLDQLVTDRGDRLWYEYDFGDGWEHVLAVEAVLDEPPSAVRCTAGRRACPPEDCGGIDGYRELAAWVRGGNVPSAVPELFEDADQARGWLPLDWHPDRFEVAEAEMALATQLAPPVPVAEELDVLREQLERRGDRALTDRLARSASQGGTEVSESDATRLVQPYAVLLELVGDGVQLTGAGCLPPTLVESLAERVGITRWWIGKANREDLTPPVAMARASARALGLLSVRKGRLAPTPAARRIHGDAVALWRHITSRLPVGSSEFDREAGWSTLAVVAAGLPAQRWRDEIEALLRAQGWQGRGTAPSGYLSVRNPTLDVLSLHSGEAGRGRATGSDAAVAATARAAIRP